MRAAWVVVIVAVVVGLFLRLKDLERARLSPDDGNAMFSARLHLMEGARTTGFVPGRWLEEDRLWIREMAEGFGKGGGRTWQHGYLHQWVMRQFRRAGAAHTTAVRIDIAILGGLTPLFLFFGYRRIFPGRPWPGVAAVVLLALSSVHAWTSQKGWGHAGCTFFLVPYFFSAYRLFARIDERDTRALFRCAFGLAFWSVLAFGYHEMASVYVFCMGLVALLVPLWSRNLGGVAHGGYLRRLLVTRKTWTFVASSLPVGLMTLGFLFFNPWAQTKYFDPSPEAVSPRDAGAPEAVEEPEAQDEAPSRGWLDYRVRSLELLLVYYEMPQQISVPVLLLAALGMFAAVRRDRFHFAFTFANLALPVAVFLLYYNLPYNMRIYLPAIVLLVLFAGEGAVWVWEAARGTAARGMVAVTGAAIVLFLAATTWVSLYGPIDHPLFVTGFYGEDMDVFDTELPVVDYLRANLRAGQSVGTVASKEAWFILDDAGIPAHFEALTAALDEWPEYLFAVADSLENMKFWPAAACYELVVKEGAGRLGLFRKDMAKVERVKEMQRDGQRARKRGRGAPKDRGAATR